MKGFLFRSVGIGTGGTEAPHSNVANYLSDPSNSKEDFLAVQIIEKRPSYGNNSQLPD